MSSSVRKKPSANRSRLGRRPTRSSAGVDEDLESGRGQVAAYALLGDYRGQVAAGAVAADADKCRVGAQVLGMLDGPAEGGDGVLGCDRRLSLGGEAVVD